MSIRVKVGTGYRGTLVAGEGPITSECNCVHQCMPDGMKVWAIVLFICLGALRLMTGPIQFGKREMEQPQSWLIIVEVISI